MLVALVGCSLVTRPSVHVDCTEMKMAALPQSVDRLSFEGFSVMPPHGHWCIEHLDRKTGVVLVTSPLLGRVSTEPPLPEESSHGFLARAMVVDIEGATVESTPQLRDFVDRWLRAGQPSYVSGGKTVLSAQQQLERFKLVESEVTEDSSLGTECIRFSATIEERNNPSLPGDTLLQVTKRNFLCRSPRSKMPIFILIGPAERYSQTHEPSWKFFDTARRQVESFTRSLEFSDLP